MESIWYVFQSSGWVGFLLIPVAMLAFVLAALGLLGGMIAKKSRAFTFVAAAGVAMSALGLVLGGFGGWYGRSRVDELLQGSAIDEFSKLEEIWTVGYEEARAAPTIALVLLALPLLIGLLGGVVAWLRSRDAVGKRPVVDVAVMGLMVVVAFLGLGLSGYGMRDGSEDAKAKALARLNDATAGVLAKTSCDP